MPRIARVCAEGYPHHITQRGNNKDTVFFDNEDRKFYLYVLQRYKNKYEIKILAYCLMGNHVHILAVPEKETSLARGMGGTNLLYTQHINRKYERNGRLWQNRFFSTLVEEDPYLWAVMRYIERNPVRARLVKKAEDYPWSSARAHVLGIKDDVLSEESLLNEKELKSYREFLRKEDEEIDANIRRATSIGRPLGSEGFIKKLERILGRHLFPKKGGRPRRKK
ncbi:MAG: transposase [Thermodesulfovibrionales bacterium]|nr:transposase [Nitrospinota bacterium]MCG2710517.1 transposase [Thermodesulfovibrionales bacterium]